MPFLEFLFDPSRGSKKVEINHLPFLIGRGSTTHFTIPSPTVSAQHAEIFERDGAFWIRDLASRNGIHVNGQPISETRLANGDIIHVAHSELRFFTTIDRSSATESLPPTTDPLTSKIPPSVLHGKPILQDLIREDSIRVIFQPIIDLNSGNPIGYEALGRGCSPQLATRPAELFRLAEICGMAVDLSRAFRRAAVRLAASEIAPGAVLFINLHPRELAAIVPDTLQRFLLELPRPDEFRPVVLEVHEDTVTDFAKFRWFCSEMRSRGIGIAFDDFGIGQSRLTELADLPPDYVKIDQRLIRDIDASRGRGDTVRAICRLARNQGFHVIAEGIETRRELETCIKMGCTLGQGFLLGHPEFAGPPLKYLEAATAAQLPAKTDSWSDSRTCTIAPVNRVV